MPFLTFPFQGQALLSEQIKPVFHLPEYLQVKFGSSPSSFEFATGRLAFEKLILRWPRGNSSFATRVIAFAISFIRELQLEELEKRNENA